MLGSSGEVRSIRIIVVSLSEATQNPVAMLVRELGKQKHGNHSYLVQHNKISLSVCHMQGMLLVAVDVKKRASYW